MRPAGLDDAPDFALFRAQHIAQMFERRHQFALDTQSGTDVNRGRDRVIAALTHVDMIVRVHGLAQPPRGQRGNHFVGVHVRAGARTGLENIDGEVLIVAARGDQTKINGGHILFLINGPIVNSLREGQSSHVILLFLVVGLVLWRRKHDYAAGLAFGFGALIKLPLLLLGFYFVLRQRWAIVAGGATTIGVAAFLSLLLFGIDGNVAWYQDWVVPYLNGYIPAYNVQSVDGFLVRLSHGEEFLIHWDPPLVPTTFHRIARFLMFAALYGGSLVLIWRAHRRAPVVMAEGGPSPRDLLELSLMINLALLTSPISWTHYYLWLLLPWALYLGGDLPLRDDATTRFLMRASVTLVSLPVIIWSPMEPSWYAAILSRTLVSVWLIGGCLSFVALARGLWQFEAAPAGDKVSTALRAAP